CLSVKAISSTGALYMPPTPPDASACPTLEPVPLQNHPPYQRSPIFFLRKRQILSRGFCNRGGAY
ncbi:hypothetical protein, partial [Mesorhizobium sp. M7A.T.Ca.US.000.02.1.1]|uniref:hypothetical protein n=1 Tax=Mesorhizobium sp. M7A.T.Ca.US.000.02.1.1 TaxID=2496792 RepID=UPI0019D42E77